MKKIKINNYWVDCFHKQPKPRPEQELLKIMVWARSHSRLAEGLTAAEVRAAVAECGEVCT